MAAFQGAQAGPTLTLAADTALRSTLASLSHPQPAQPQGAENVSAVCWDFISNCNVSSFEGKHDKYLQFSSIKEESTHPRRKKKSLKSPARTLHKLGNLESMREPLAQDPKVGKRPSPNKAAS